MGYVIEAENLLANYFANNPNKKTVSVHELKTLRRKIESLIPQVYVGITYDFLLAAESGNPECFSWDEEESFSCSDFGRKLLNFESGYLEENYNWKIPLEIKNPYLNFMASSSN